MTVGEPLADAAELSRLEEAVGGALATGDQSGLRILGFGEITLVLGWPAAARGSPPSACPSSPTATGPRPTAR